MSESCDLRSILERIAASTNSDTDIQMLRDNIQAGRIVLASGERAVALGGDANDAVIITGNGNLVYIFKGADAEAVRKLIQQLTPDQIYSACKLVTPLLAEDLSRGQTVIPRKNIQTLLDRFLTSPLRYCLLRGPSGVGKSVVMATEAIRLLESGWAAILMRAQGFSLQYLAERVAQDGLKLPTTPGWRQIMAEPWEGKFPTNLRGFVLLIDALDETDLGKIVPELLKLHDGLGGVSSDHVKVILSCHELIWERLSQHLPLWRDVRASSHQTSSDIEVITITDFEAEELDGALAAINARELLTPGRPGEWADPHVEAIRNLLRHPGTFGLYAELHGSGDVPSIQNLTWSRLVEQYLGKALARAGAQSGINLESLQEQLINLAKLVRQEKSRDMSLSVDKVRKAMPDLDLDRSDPALSRYAALVRHGVLHERPAAIRRRLVGFSIADVGSYLVSLGLEREAHGLSESELRELLTTWVREVHDYPPLLDAILAWIDRLADTPQNPTLLVLLDALVEEPFRTEIVFRLVRPTVMKSLFAAARRKEPDAFYAYREAAKAVRPSPEVLEEIRRHFHDRDSRYREWAAQLAGIHRDTQAIPGLLKLLQDSEEDVREAASVALARIGERSVQPLLAVIHDLAQSTQFRRRCVEALGRIGFRNGAVSAALTGCLRYGQTGDIDLLRSALLAAVQLRDVKQTSYAVGALSSDDWQIVVGAAQLLTEGPEPSAFSALRETLERWSSLERGSMTQSLVLRQVLAALIQMETPEATGAVLEFLRESLRNSGESSPVAAVWAADDLDLPETHRLLFEDIIQRLDDTPQDYLLWHSFNRLHKTWQPDQLAALAEATHQLADQGVDVAQRIVDGIIQGLQATDDRPLREEHAQANALHVLAKCQADGSAAEVSRLLLYADGPFVLGICEALWVIGDPKAEEALLHKLEQPASQAQAVWYERNRIIRALGTCSTKRGGSAVLAYLRSEPRISTNLPREAICPLVKRGVLNQAQLIEIVRDHSASIQGRSSSMVALSILDTSAHRDLFREIIAQAEDETLRGYAVRMLGLTQDQICIVDLQSCLRRTRDVFVAAQAAWALGRLNARQAVSKIERALEEFADTEHANYFMNALKQFREPSSLPVLREALPRSRFLHVRAEIIEALGAFLPDVRAREPIVAQLETWRGGNIDLGEQCPPIRALARYDPNLLLSLVKNLYDAGRLDRSAREELARWIPLLTRRDHVEKAALLGLIQQLVCDQYLPVRERAAQAFGRIDQTFCVEIYNELRHTSEDWAQACAVYTLGFWESDEREIQSAQYAEAFLIRYAGDAALEMRRRRHALQQLVEQYRSTNNLARLSAYLAIKEQGDEQTIWALRDTVQEADLAQVFLQQLASDVHKRLRDERRKRADEEQKLLAAAGTVRFN